MSNCKPCSTPVDTLSKLGPNGPPITDPTLYRSLAGALQYLTFTRPDITYAVQQLCLSMHDPREPHFNALKRVLRYVLRTIDNGLQIFPSSTTKLSAYYDAYRGGIQATVSRSSTEAEYRAVANAVAETCWIRNLLCELHSPLSHATFVYCDNATKQATITAAITAVAVP
ncbi:uncharacterized mitochondrial protein AtMg00810-like [Rutidosis leptorrhynchoides]|uniref:uncharacterized mitochondrial protein AtMg00810-like n=1 Tax=Rutidosis leptorrhynchoides TaxID=125765 RepID=UPI003A9A3D0A